MRRIDQLSQRHDSKRAHAKGKFRMTTYRVSFFKNLQSSDGHAFKCVQQVIEIRRAKSPDRAVRAAERRYERRHHVPDWQLYADTLELEIDGKKNLF